MKRLFLLLFAVAVCGCTNKPGESSNPISLNGFKVGDEGDQIIYKIGREPSKKNDTGLLYKEETFEGVRDYRIEYILAGGRLVGINLMQMEDDKVGEHKRLADFFIKEYGTPKIPEKGLMMWRDETTTLTLHDNEKSPFAILIRNDMSPLK